MTISAPRYAAASGPRLGRNGRVLAIFWNEVGARAGWGTWAVVALSYLAIVLILIFTAEFASAVGSVSVSTFHAPYSSPIWPYLILIVATAVGAGAVADDLGSRAITLYLSRPIHLTDYLLAKSSSVAFWVGVTAIGPGVLGVTIATGLGLTSAEVGFTAVVAFVAVGLLTTFFFTGLAVVLSTITTRSLYAGVGIFGVTLSTNIAAAAVAGATGNNSVGYLSPVSDVLAASEAAFTTHAASALDPATATAVLVAAAAILFVVAWMRLTRVEVVGE